MIDFILTHGKISAVIALVVFCIIVWAALVILAGWQAFPSEESIKSWTVQEAIFYGFALLAFITFVKG